MSRNRTGIAVLCLASLVALPAWAQDEGAPQMTPEQMAEMQAYMEAGTPGPPHEALAKTAGTYELAVTSWPAPGAPAMKESATATRTMLLGGRVMLEVIEGTMMGMPFTGRRLEGHDNVTGEQWGVWMDSMSTGMMVSHGTCDADNACTYEGSWNDPITKGPFEVRMTSAWTGPDTMLFEMYGPGKDGQEYKMMEIVYTKKG